MWDFGWSFSCIDFLPRSTNFLRMKRAWVAAAVLAISHSRATDWPQWRGANRNGVSPEKLSAHWPADGPVVVWRASVGTGFSSVSVSQGRAYTMGNTNGQEIIWCLDALTGKEIWKHTYP